nr:hypothetical protein [Tanacetum cinerariifolium]
GDQAREQGDKAMNKDKGKNPVVTITGFRDLNEEFAECINNSSNVVSAAGPSLSAAGLDFTNITNDFTAAGPLLSAAELNFTNNTNDFSDAGPSNVAMPNLEDLSHNADDVGAEADTNNMESVISAIGTKWVYRNKKDERDIVIKNKARLVAQGHTQEEGIDYEEVKQKNDGIFITQDKYVAEILRKFGLSKEKSASTLIDAEKPLLKDSDDKDVDVHTY